MIEVKRKQNESVGAMMRRFSMLLKKERILDQAKKKRFYKKPKNKFQRKKEALARIKNQKRKRYLKKVGLMK